LANWREIKSMNYQTVTFVLEDDSTKARVTNAVAEVHTKTSPSRISLFLARAFGLRKSMKTKEATIRLSTGTIALQVPRRFNVFHEIFFVAPGYYPTAVTSFLELRHYSVGILDDPFAYESRDVPATNFMTIPLRRLRPEDVQR
jgi:hypothetical protein